MSRLILSPPSVRPEPVEGRQRRASVLRQAQHERNIGVLRFAGYAALFDRVDAGRDILRRGAFARTLAERAGPFPLFWQHRPEQRIGWIEAIVEDARGLRVIAALDIPAGRAAALLRRRAVSGLSFGYRARKFRHTPEGRVLEDVDLFEVSLVTHPLQHGARVHLINEDPPRHGEVAAAAGG